MSLGDSIIGATAFHHNLKLCTNNIKDFQAVKELDFASVDKFFINIMDLQQAAAALADHNGAVPMLISCK